MKTDLLPALLAALMAQSVTAAMTGSFRSPDRVKFCKGSGNSDCTDPLEFNYNECTTLVDSDQWGKSGNNFQVGSSGNGNLNTKCRLFEDTSCSKGFGSDVWRNSWNPLPTGRYFQAFICYVCDKDAMKGSCGTEPKCQQGC